MDGFKVEPAELAQMSAKFYTVCRQLTDDAGRLRKALELLNGQTVAAEVINALRAQYGKIELCAQEARELGAQCVEIAEVYNGTERLVASVVAALPSVSPFAEDQTATQTLGFARVNTRFKPAEPVLLSGNQLPCENWLLDRAIKASLEGDQ